MSIQKNKIVKLTAFRRRVYNTTFKEEDNWRHPTTFMEQKAKYNRNRQKKEARELIHEYEEA